MAEIQFFATDQDHELVVTELVSRYHATFVLDAGHSLPLRAMSTVAEVMSAIASDEHGPRFFVVSQQWQQEPLGMSELRREDGTVRYHVRGRCGGPSLDYIAKRQIGHDLGGHIVPSSMGSHASYYLASGEEPCPASMRSALATVQRVVGHGGRRTFVVETGKPGPVAMVHALQAHNLGSWLRVGGWHHEPRET
jgi:hypothetical protein